MIDWLLESDPAIRWQVLRDLADAGPDQVAAERDLIATQGWGAQLLWRPGSVDRGLGRRLLPARMGAGGSAVLRRLERDALLARLAA